MRQNSTQDLVVQCQGHHHQRPLEVTFHLTDPQPSLLAMLAGGFSPIYPCHVPAAQMRTHPIGTGPFKFVEFQAERVIRLERNPNYWKPGRPYLDAIEYTIIPNRSTMMLALVAGKYRPDPDRRGHAASW